MRSTILSLCMLLAFVPAKAGDVVLDNGVVRREISLSDGHVLGQHYSLQASGFDFIRSGSPEFSLNVNDRTYTGRDYWTGITSEESDFPNQGKGVTVRFASPDGAFSIELDYITYPGLPAVRKYLSITNTGKADLKVEAVDVENVSLRFSQIESWVMHQYGRFRSFGPYTGNWDDPLVVIHDNTYLAGIAAGNETIGVLKRTSVFLDETSLTIGTTRPGDTYPFRRWLRPGDTWRSAGVFTTLYDGTKDPSLVVNTEVQDFVRKHMGTRIEQLEHKPTFVYNTWYPFKSKINADLICSLADAAAECGVEEFIIDDGWEINLDSKPTDRQNMGDWVVDKTKFPDGLKPVFDYIKSKGMKPGVWISFATADPSSRPYKEHPEWFVVGPDGKLTDLHNQDSWSRTACLGTDWFDYIKERILFLEKEYGLAYVKLDLSILASAYVFDTARTGCYATNHPGHRDRPESFDVIYSRCMELMDELHKLAPDLFIDCTFETAGKLQLMDYGIALHADGNWLSNIEQPYPVGAFRMRDMAWERCPALPPASLVIGNLSMTDPEALLNFKSLTGTLPIMLGDPRELGKEQRAAFKSLADWLKGLESRHGFMSFRQDVPGFGEPGEGRWDAFCRINTDTRSGGLVGVFRQGAREKSRRVTVPYLDPDRRYKVRRGPDGKVVFRGTGKKLSEKGFKVRLRKDYDGELFEIIANN